MFQFRIFLLEGFIIKRKMVGRVSFGLLSQTRNLVRHLVVLRTDPLGVDPQSGSDQERTKETCQQSSDHGAFARVDGPIQRCRIVRDVQQDWVWIVRDVFSLEYCQRCAVINDHCYELQDVNRDQLSIFIVLPVEQRSIDYVLWELQVPPKS